MSDEGYSLGKSAKGLGKLTPILKDAHGNIIDGFHRQNENPDWESIKVGSVDTPQKLELARLAVNFCRRTMGAEEMQNRIAFLVGKCGMKPEEIAELTGIGVSTIYKYLPQELKDKKKVDAGRIGGETAGALRVEQTVKTPETPITFTRPPQGEEKPREFPEHPVVCSVCGISTFLFPELYKTIDGKTYCDKCAEREKPKPKLTVEEPKAAVEKAEKLKALMERAPDAPEDDAVTVVCNECGALFHIIHNRDGSHTLTKVK